MTFLEALRVEFDEEVKKTRKILERVPERSLAWKPHEKSMTLGRLSGHLAELAGRPAAIVPDIFVRPAGYVPFSAATCSELMQRFEESAAEGRQALHRFTEEDMAKPWTLKFGDKVMIPEMPKWMALRAVVMNHMIHHRGQLGVFLRLLDVPIPGMFGPSADEQSR